ncbi:unnamed protein product [Allacma fusca]|uniref:Uncharacterized protein n=1 Tax=Allacma fusca TaxID=39272 RepID=A0A8J2K536_9HEXA|nr:unnamed protein product [Allacma fusca]
MQQLHFGNRDGKRRRVFKTREKAPRSIQSEITYSNLYGKELSGVKDIHHQGNSPRRVQTIYNLISPNQSTESTPVSNLDSNDSSKILENYSRRSIESILNTSNIGSQKVVLGELHVIRIDIEMLRAISCNVTDRDECPFEMPFQVEQEL